MKKLSFVLLLLLVSLVLPGHTRAAGIGAANFDFTPSPATVVADGRSTMTVTVLAWQYRCSVENEYGTQYSLDPDYCASHGFGTASKEGMNIGDDYTLVSDPGTTISPTSFGTDAGGNGSFTIKSTVAGTKTVKILFPNGSAIGSATVTFTSPAPTPAPTTTPKTTTPAPAPAPTPAASPTAAPTLGTVNANGSQLDTAKPITIEQSKPLTLSGTAVPNSTVTLTIHSTPRTVTTTADKDGHWTYTVNDLEPGDHYVEATVTDPTTHKTSDPVKLVSFTVTPKKTTPIAATTSAPTTQKSHTRLWISLGIAVLILLGGGWYGWRWLQKKRASGQSQSDQTPPINP